MINISDLELEANCEKLKGITVSRFNSYENMYSWVEVLDTTPDKSLANVPLVGSLTPFTRRKQLTTIFKQDAICWPCFGQFTCTRRKDKNSRVIFTSYLMKEHMSSVVNNHCWVDKNIVRYWIDALIQEAELDFYYTIKENNKQILVIFDFKDLNCIQTRLVLFWTRYLFEYPSSLCMIDALFLKRDYYPDELVFNLLTLVVNSQSIGANVVSVSPWQCITKLGKFVSKEYLVRKVHHPKLSSVNNIVGYDISSVRNIFEEINQFGLTKEEVEKLKSRALTIFFPIKDWIDRPERFISYQECYNKMKKIERNKLR